MQMVRKRVRHDDNLSVNKERPVVLESTGQQTDKQKNGQGGPKIMLCWQHGQLATLEKEAHNLLDQIQLPTKQLDKSSVDCLHNR